MINDGLHGEQGNIENKVVFMVIEMIKEFLLRPFMGEENFYGKRECALFCGGYGVRNSTMFRRNELNPFDALSLDSVSLRAFSYEAFL